MKPNNRLFLIEKWPFFVLFAMIGLVMYWTAIVVEPTKQILSQNQKIVEQEAQQTDTLLKNQNATIEYLVTYIEQTEQNRKQFANYLVTILNQSNVIGNATADLILESIADIKTLEQNLTTNNDVQRARIVEDIATALEHIDKNLLTLSEQHKNLSITTTGEGPPIKFISSTATATSIEENESDQTGHISGFLGGPLITNESIPYELLYNMPPPNSTNNATGNITE